MLIETTVKAGTFSQARGGSTGARQKTRARGVLGWRTVENSRAGKPDSAGSAWGPQIQGPQNMRADDKPNYLDLLVFPAGFEPTAPRLGIWCSIRLSYGNP